MLNDREILLPHSKRTIRAFLRNCDAVEESALWSFVYRDHMGVLHDVAHQVSTEMETTTKTVGDLLGGWLPEALHG